MGVEAGELIAVVGANGSGKSTLGRALAGLVPLEAGRVVGRGGSAARVGLVLQDPAAQLIAATVADEIALGVQSRGAGSQRVGSRVDDAVTAHRLESIWHRDPARLSGGQQQRVAMAAIDACDVDVLVLDEPTALLDPPARHAFAARLREGIGGRGAVWITQEPDEVAACDRLIVLDAGQLVWQGSVDQWVADPSLAATWGLDLPVAARLAHALAASGAWSGGVPIPARGDALLHILGGARARG
jgi:energy-coupling factor transport system ATP-binding protein